MLGGRWKRTDVVTLMFNAGNPAGWRQILQKQHSSVVVVAVPCCCPCHIAVRRRGSTAALRFNRLREGETYNSRWDAETRQAFREKTSVLDGEHSCITAKWGKSEK